MACVNPLATLAEGEETMIDEMTGGTTVSVTDEEMLPTDAVSVANPCPIPVATPVETTLAIEWLVEVQLTPLTMSG